MTDAETAVKVLETLQAAEREPPEIALPMLNGLVSLARGEGGQPLEAEEARASAFIAICEIGKALHRGRPANTPWQPAFAATERWKSLVT